MTRSSGRGLWRTMILPALAVLALGACTDTMKPTDPSPSAPRLAIIDSLITQTPEDVGVTPLYFKVCKVGPAGHVTRIEVTEEYFLPHPATLVDTIEVEAGTCKVAQGNPNDPIVTLRELVPAGFHIDSIFVKRSFRMKLCSGCTLEPRQVETRTVIGQDSVTEVISHLGIQPLPRPEQIGAVAIFYDSPDQSNPGTQGCTPGYWKQKQHFGSWVGYSPNAQFSSVFEDAFPGMTLLEVLSQGGGGLNALGRHTVAALLDAASGIDYGLEPAQVIQKFNAAYASGDYETLKDELASRNERTCPLGRNP